jgi:hypothetical protein
MHCFWVVTLIFSLSIDGVLIAEEKEPELSKESLSIEQAEIYQVFLESFSKNAKEKSVFYLANITVPLDQKAFEFDRECVRGMHLEQSEDPAKTVHHLDEKLFSGLKIVLVDADKKAKSVEENDPQTLVQDVAQYLPDEFNKQLEDSIEGAIQNGYWTVSEVIFDQKHNHAVISAGFHCGSLCGFGNMIVFKKSGKKWKINKQCGGWIS